jgi:hypothetical protein
MNPNSDLYMFGRLEESVKKQPTIYNALRAKLNREPTNAELKAEVSRIISEGTLAGIQKRIGRR